MTTRETIERWVELFNANDPVALSALYAEDAVNHQIAWTPSSVVRRSSNSTARRSRPDR